MYGTSIGLKPQNSAMIISKIKKGLPAGAFERLRKNLDVSEKALSDEYNYLLNPTHPDFSKIKIGKPIVYFFDPRLTKQ